MSRRAFRTTAAPCTRPRTFLLRMDSDSSSSPCRPARRRPPEARIRRRRGSSRRSFPDAPRTWTELLFFSFVLLSSTGIGDIIQLTPQARALASLEIFVGVMYLALVVSRLIGLSLLTRSESKTG